MQQLANTLGLQDSTPTPVGGTMQIHGASAPTLSEAVLQAIVECGGNIKLAGERLSSQYPQHFPTRPTPAQLAAHLEGHQSELKERMELVQLLDMLSFMPQLHMTLQQSLTNLTGSDAVRAYTDLQGMIQKAIRKDEMTLNINDMRWKLLPRNIAQLFAELEATGQLEQVLTIDGDWQEKEAS